MSNKFKIGDLVEWTDSRAKHRAGKKTWIGIVLKYERIKQLQQHKSNPKWPLVYWFEMKNAYHAPPENLRKIL